MSERLSFTRKNRLCDNCFKEGHIAVFCKSNNFCSVKNCAARRKHHTLLHRNYSAQSSRSSDEANSPSVLSELPNTTRSVCFTSSGDDCVFLNVMPVKVFANNREVTTYAFLDQGSTVTLCNQHLLDELGIKGQTASINLTTLNERA